MNREQLIEFLDGESNEWGLDSVATHGFLTASVVGPALADWMNALFDGHAADVSAEVREAIMEWRTEIEQTLANEETLELPFEVDEASVDSELGDWSIGFVDALFLNDEAWFADPENEDSVVMLTVPMMVFSGIEGDEDLESVRRNGDLLDQMADEIPDNLTKLYLLFHAPDEK